ncbi:MAG: acyltransferase family protein [Lachnospiraceae bacterium]|nr:acyltransferase family protein [Lachnospiraceae bacterium]
MQQSDTNNNRVYSLDFIRVIACMGICWLHYRLFLCPQGVFFGNRLINEEELGWEFKFFVEVFFGLSGYLSFSQIEKIRQGRSFSQYYKIKLIRILPMLTIGTILYEIMVAVMVENSRFIRDDFSAPSLWGIISSSIGIQEGWGFINSRINMESWYLDVLLLCFAFFYFIVWISMKLNVKVNILFGIMIIIGCTASSYSFSIPFLNSQDGRGYEAFFTGLLLATHVSRKGVRIKDAILSGFILFVYGMYHVFWPELLFFGRYHLMALLVTPALIVFMETSIMKKIFLWKYWETLGKITFSTYILHVVLIFAIFNLETRLRLSIDYAHEVMLIAFIILAFTIGAVAYFAIEKPVTKFLLKAT